MTYNSGTGRYQQRADYYEQLPAVGNIYLVTFGNILNLYNNFHRFGIHFFNAQDVEAKLSVIRETEGLARCWGYASEVIELIARWRVNEEANNVDLAETLESLMDIFLEILPAYVPWVPKAKLPENQAVINFLQSRGDAYRAIGNPKFYAYDRIVMTLSNTTIPVTVNNCKYFKGVGPRISGHITDFLTGKVQLPEPVLETDALEIVTAAEPETDALEIVTAAEPVLETDALEIVTAAEPVLELPWADRQAPELMRSENNAVAAYLWSKSIEFYNQGYITYALAWRRAAETVYTTEYSIEDYLNVLDECTYFPYIGEKMADVIREFYQFTDRQMSPVLGMHSIPRTPPQATIDREEEGELQQRLLTALWNNGHRELAVEIAEYGALPQTLDDFKSFNHYSPHLIELFYTYDGDLPVAKNWRNKALVEWLWNCGEEYSNICAINYHNAAHSVARRRNVLYLDDLEEIKYIGPYTAERARENWPE